MNSFAFILLIIALIIGIAAAKGKQDDLVAALTGKKYGDSNLQ